MYITLFPGGASGKESACQWRRCKRRDLNPWVGKIPWRRKWQPTPVFLPGKFHRQRNLAGYSLWGHKELDTHTHTHTHTHIYFIVGSLYLLIPSLILSVPQLWQPPVGTLYLLIYFYFLWSFFFVFQNLYIKKSHMVFVFLWLTYFT